VTNEKQVGDLNSKEAFLRFFEVVLILLFDTRLTRKEETEKFHPLPNEVIISFIRRVLLALRVLSENHKEARIVDIPDDFGSVPASFELVGGEVVHFEVIHIDPIAILIDPLEGVCDDTDFGAIAADIAEPHFAERAIGILESASDTHLPVLSSAKIVDSDVIVL
jgi:hypothetical protein